MDVKWREGVWLVHVGSSTEMSIGTEEGVVKAFTVRRLVGP